MRAWRSLHEFAEAEIYLPTGPHKGRPFRLKTQPFVRLLFDEVASGNWNEIVGVGPSQSGKTLAFAIMMLWHLFELSEDVIYAAPTMPMCSDKYMRDIQPILARTRFASLQPRHGRGARGGFGDLLRFRNGSSIKFMSGGGGDKAVAGYTARVIFITEANGFKTQAASLETDRISQIEARAKSFGNRKMIYKECTVEDEACHIWQRWEYGTASELYVRCQHCQAHVMVTRDDLRGWRDVDNSLDAEEQASFFCSSCGEAWTEYQRKQAVSESLVVHRGQHVEAGQVRGEAPRTRTLGFRWSAAHNLFVSQGELAAEEWEAAKLGNPDNLERKINQFVWATPHENPDAEISELDAVSVSKRMASWTRGVVPDDADCLTVGVDVQKRYLYYTVLATWVDCTRAHVVDYGRLDVDTDTLGIDDAMIEAFDELKTRVEAGWYGRDVTRVLVDCGAFQTQVYRFLQCKETNRAKWVGSLGRGHNQRMSRAYTTPTRTTAVIQAVYDSCHLKYIANRQIYQVEFNSDIFKSRLHEGLKSADDTRKITLPQGMHTEHVRFASQLAAEKQEEKYIPGKGQVVLWTQTSKANHWLDSTVMALVAASTYREKVRYARSKHRPSKDHPSDGEDDKTKFRGFKKLR